MKAKRKPDAERPAWSQIADLQKFSLQELRAEYEHLFGKPTRSRSRKQLFAQISRKLQQHREKSSSRQPRKSALTATFQPKRKAPRSRRKSSGAGEKGRQTKPVGSRDPRLPKIGTTITREYKGKTLRVRLLEKGFEYQGGEFRSLSAVAREITGSTWNGFLFFGLAER